MVVFGVKKGSTTVATIKTVEKKIIEPYVPKFSYLNEAKNLTYTWDFVAFFKHLANHFYVYVYSGLKYEYELVGNTLGFL